jgi:phenylacetic acid degradation protein
MVAACSFVRAKFTCEARSMVMGTPAKVARQLSADEVNWKTQGTKEYTDLALRAKQTLREVQPLSEIQADRPRFNASNHQTKN